MTLDPQWFMQELEFPPAPIERAAGLEPFPVWDTRPKPLDEDDDDGALRRFDRSPSEALRFVGRR